ncbi:MAG: hydantoinase/oxoprolinase family protein [Candidatus Limnocylindrales bacterium]
MVVSDPEPAASSLTSATIGLDMGGTFVDSVLLWPSHPIVEAKALTTPGDPVTGIMAALQATADAAAMPLRGLLSDTGAIIHGTTLGLNTIVGGNGARVGLLATRGHEDAILIGRVRQKVAGLRPHQMTRVADLRKPRPLVPRWDIAGVHERIDAAGQVVVTLDEPGVLEAADRLVTDGCEALVVAFLWSHLRSDHERRAAQLIETAHPGVPVVLSSAVAPVIGEYERTAAAIINASLLARFSGYLDRLGRALASAGFGGSLWIMGMTGGVMPADAAAQRPVETMHSGPIGGIMAAAHVGVEIGRSTLIATDMGGTSFDVGLIVDGEAQQTDFTIVGQFDIAAPAVQVRSIGAGGGSIAWLDDFGGLHVGPRSAGAEPGPACYGRGGAESTVTDADLVLGRLDRETVLGGQIRLDLDAARRSIAPIAERIGVSVVEAAAGIVRIADAQMADLIRTATIERGHDPRAFTLVAFGGAGPLHVGRFAADVGVKEALIPQSAAVFSALGLASADYRRTYRRSRRMALPLDPVQISPIFTELRREAEEDFGAAGLAGLVALTPWLDIRYGRQTHQLRVAATWAGQGEVDLDAVGADFEALYERTFGPGTGYAAAGMEATAIGLHALAAGLAAGTTSRLGSSRRSRGPARRSAIRRRPVWFDAWIDDTPVYGATDLALEEAIGGPAIVDYGATSLVVHPGQTAVVDEHGNLRLRFTRAASR